MNAIKAGMPPPNNYLNFSDRELLQRLHSIAAGNITASESERALIYNLLTTRAQTRSNKTNRWLVFATWALAVATILMALVTAVPSLVTSENARLNNKNEIESLKEKVKNLEDKNLKIAEIADEALYRLKEQENKSLAK